MIVNARVNKVDAYYTRRICIYSSGIKLNVVSLSLNASRLMNCARLESYIGVLYCIRIARVFAQIAETRKVGAKGGARSLVKKFAPRD